MLLLFLFVHLTKSQSIVVPVDIHLPILFKVMSLEKKTNKSDLEIFVVAVVYEGSNEKSVTVKNEILLFNKSKQFELLDGKSVHFVTIDIGDTKDIQTLLHETNPCAIYIAPLTPNVLRQVISTTQKEKILSITGVPEYVDEGVSIGIGVKGDYPEIIINLAASKGEGAEFSSKVLGVARIIQ